MMISIRSLMRPALTMAALVAVLAFGDTAGATPQKRLTDSNASGAEAVCGAMGGFSSTVATGNVQVEIEGSKGKTKTSTTECSGGFLGGMTCDNYSNGSSHCAMGFQTGGSSVGGGPVDAGPGTVVGGVQQIQSSEADVIPEEAAPAADQADLVETPSESGDTSDGSAEAVEPTTGGETEEPAADEAAGSTATTGEDATEVSETVVEGSAVEVADGTTAEPADAGATVVVAAPGAEYEAAEELEPEEAGA